MKIGWSENDVTPQQPTALRGQRHVRVTDEINDPLTVTALAVEGTDLSGNQQQVIVISCDRVTVATQLQTQVREILENEIPEFDSNNLIMNATHTHTAPVAVEGKYPPQDETVMTPNEYADFFSLRAAQAAIDAWNTMAPGGVSCGLGHAVVGHNRRITYADGHSEMYGNTDREDFRWVEGYEDHTVDLLFTYSEDRQLTGVAVNVACPSQVTESENYISADFWHEVRLELRRRHGDGLFVLPQCAAAGDQSPHLQLYEGPEAQMRQRRSVTEREEIAHRVANAVDDVLPVAKDDRVMTDPPVSHTLQTLSLPARRITEDEYRRVVEENQELEANKPSAGDRIDHSRWFWNHRRYQRVIQAYQKQDDDPKIDTDVHVLRLGDVAIATNQFELFLDFGLRIKARSSAPQTFIVQLAATRTGRDGTYLPTQRAVAAKAYGAQAVDNIVGPEGGQVLVEQTLDMIDHLWQ